MKSIKSVFFTFKSTKFSSSCIRGVWDYKFSTYTKFSEKTNISYPWYAYVKILKDYNEISLLKVSEF